MKRYNFLAALAFGFIGVLKTKPRAIACNPIIIKAKECEGWKWGIVAGFSFTMSDGTKYWCRPDDQNFEVLYRQLVKDKDLNENEAGEQIERGMFTMAMARQGAVVPLERSA